MIVFDLPYLKLLHNNYVILILLFAECGAILNLLWQHKTYLIWYNDFIILVQFFAGMWRNDVEIKRWKKVRKVKRVVVVVITPPLLNKQYIFCYNF